MAQDTFKRKLTTIFSVDAVDYSRLMKSEITLSAGILQTMLRADTEESLSEKDFQISVDDQGKPRPGEAVLPTPGKSICLEPFIHHRFYGEQGKGTVLVGEVSDVNDDGNDNCFLNPLKRFPQIVEDEDPIHYLCTEYPPAIVR